MSAQDFVTNITDQNIAFGKEMGDLTEAAVSKAQTAAEGFAQPGPIGNSGGVNVGPGTDTPFAPPLHGFTIDNPEIFQGQFVEPVDKPEAPVLDQVHQAQIPDVPGNAPDINTSGLFSVTKPVAFSGVAPQAPFVGAPLQPIPTPDINDVQSPDLVDIQTHEAPQITLPNFNGGVPNQAPQLDKDLVALFNNTYDSTLPNMVTAVQSNVDFFFDTLYPQQKARMELLEARIAKDLQGGTGYSETVRQAIHDRARSEIAKGLVSAERDALQASARRGFLIPDGVATALISAAVREANDRIARAELEITHKIADQEQANAQFALQQAVQLRLAIRDGALQYTGTMIQLNGQALNIANSTVRNCIDAYNARAAVYNTELQYFRAHVDLYEVQARASFLEVERYQALIAAEEAKTNVNRARIEKMRAELEAEENKIEIFSARINAQRNELERRRLLAEVFGTEVEAFSARIRAKRGEYDAYTAAISGDRAKLEAQIARIDAYRTEVGAAVDIGRLELAKSDVGHKANQHRLAQYDAELRTYLSGVEVEKVRFDAGLRAYMARLEVFKERIDQLETEAKLNVDVAVAKSDAELKLQRLKLEQAIESARAWNDKIERVTRTAMVAAETYSQIGSSAMSATATMSSVAFEEQQES